MGATRAIVVEPRRRSIAVDPAGLALATATDLIEFDFAEFAQSAALIATHGNAPFLTACGALRRRRRLNYPSRRRCRTNKRSYNSAMAKCLTPWQSHHVCH